MKKWSERDAKRVLTNSPWAKRTTPKRNGAGIAPGAAAASLPVSSPEITVRWESGLPVIHARRKSGSSLVASEGGPCYLIAIAGLHIEQPDSAPVLAATEASLRYRDRDPVKPTAVRMWRENDGTPLLVFQFPRAEDISKPGVFRYPFGITFRPNEFHFEARIGPVEVKQRFNLRDMLFLRQLAL